MSGCTGHYTTCRCGHCVRGRQEASNVLQRGAPASIGKNVVGHVVSCQCPTCLRAEQVFNSTFEEFGCQ